MNLISSEVERLYKNTIRVQEQNSGSNFSYQELTSLLGESVGELSYNLGYNKDIQLSIGKCLYYLTSMDNRRSLVGYRDWGITPTNHTAPNLPMVVYYLGRVQHNIRQWYTPTFIEDTVNFIHQLDNLAKVRGTGVLKGWEEAIRYYSGGKNNE